MTRSLAPLSVAGLLLATSLCAQITPAGITATGPYNNSADLIIDGATPAQFTPWTDAPNVWWYDFGTSFTIDLGAKFHLTDIAWSVDNNDAYSIDWSLDGSTFANLFTISPDDGEVQAWEGGMDTMNSFFGDAQYIASMDFGAVNARYLRVAAVPGGDASNAIGEVTAYGRPLGTAVPEPSTYGLFGAAALAVIGFWRRPRRG